MLEHVLYSLRVRAGLSQQDLARRARISLSVISQIESGHRLRATPETLRKLTSALQAPDNLLKRAMDCGQLWAEELRAPHPNAARRIC